MSNEGKYEVSNMDNPLFEPIQKSFRDKVSVLINLFIKPEIKENNLLGKQEFIAAAKLIKKYKDFDFFYDLPELTDKFNSLFGLLMKKNKELLDNKYKNYLHQKEKNREYILQKENIITIKLEPKEIKAMNILEFLDS